MNPWGGSTLEWQTASPPPHDNFATTPTSIGDPYDLHGLVEDKATGNWYRLPDEPATRRPGRRIKSKQQHATEDSNDRFANELLPPPPSLPEAAASHNHDPHLAHHFDTPDQQFQTGKLAMWVFLGTEILMFGGLVLRLRGLPPQSS